MSTKAVSLLEERIYWYESLTGVATQHLTATCSITEESSYLEQALKLTISVPTLLALTCVGAAETAFRCLLVVSTVILSYGVALLPGRVSIYYKSHILDPLRRQFSLSLQSTLFACTHIFSLHQKIRAPLNITPLPIKKASTFTPKKVLLAATVVVLVSGLAYFGSSLWTPLAQSPKPSLEPKEAENFSKQILNDKNPLASVIEATSSLFCPLDANKRNVSATLLPFARNTQVTIPRSSQIETLSDNNPIYSVVEVTSSLFYPLVQNIPTIPGSTQIDAPLERSLSLPSTLPLTAIAITTVTLFVFSTLTIACRRSTRILNKESLISNRKESPSAASAHLLPATFTPDTAQNLTSDSLAAPDNSSQGSPDASREADKVEQTGSPEALTPSPVRTSQDPTRSQFTDRSSTLASSTAKTRNGLEEQGKETASADSDSARESTGEEPSSPTAPPPARVPTPVPLKTSRRTPTQPSSLSSILEKDADASSDRQTRPQTLPSNPSGSTRNKTDTRRSGSARGSANPLNRSSGTASTGTGKKRKKVSLLETSSSPNDQNDSSKNALDTAKTARLKTKPGSFIWSDSNVRDTEGQVGSPQAVTPKPARPKGFRSPDSELDSSLASTPAIPARLLTRFSAVADPSPQTPANLFGEDVKNDSINADASDPNTVSNEQESTSPPKNEPSSNNLDTRRIFLEAFTPPRSPTLSSHSSTPEATANLEGRFNDTEDIHTANEISKSPTIDQKDPAVDSTQTPSDRPRTPETTGNPVGRFNDPEDTLPINAVTSGTLLSLEDCSNLIRDLTEFCTTLDTTSTLQEEDVNVLREGLEFLTIFIDNPPKVKDEQTELNSLIALANEWIEQIQSFLDTASQKPQLPGGSPLGKQIKQQLAYCSPLLRQSFNKGLPVSPATLGGASPIPTSSPLVSRAPISPSPIRVEKTLVKADASITEKTTQASPPKALAPASTVGASATPPITRISSSGSARKSESPISPQGLSHSVALETDNNPDTFDATRSSISLLRTPENPALGNTTSSASSSLKRSPRSASVRSLTSSPAKTPLSSKRETRTPNNLANSTTPRDLSRSSQASAPNSPFRAAESPIQQRRSSSDSQVLATSPSREQDKSASLDPNTSTSKTIPVTNTTKQDLALLRQTLEKINSSLEQAKQAYPALDSFSLDQINTGVKHFAKLLEEIDIFYQDIEQRSQGNSITNDDSSQLKDCQTVLLELKERIQQDINTARDLFCQKLSVKMNPEADVSHALITQIENLTKKWEEQIITLLGKIATGPVIESSSPRSPIVQARLKMIKDHNARQPSPLSATGTPVIASVLSPQTPAQSIETATTLVNTPTPPPKQTLKRFRLDPSSTKISKRSSVSSQTRITFAKAWQTRIDNLNKGINKFIIFLEKIISVCEVIEKKFETNKEKRDDTILNYLRSGKKKIFSTNKILQTQIDSTSKKKLLEHTTEMSVLVQRSIEKIDALLGNYAVDTLEGSLEDEV